MEKGSNRSVERSAEMITARPTVLQAIELAVDAYELALDVGRDPWDFAVRLEQLTRCGVSESELRWLACRDLLVAARRLDAEEGSGFVTLDQAQGFDSRTCFVVTRRGICLSDSAPQVARTRESLIPVPPELEQSESGVPLPHWDSCLRVLSFAGDVIKQFRVPADNQEAILGAFAEDGWSRRIDDPLPQVAGLDPKRRLQSAIMCLNRNQKVRRLRFRGDGSAQGVIWDPIDSGLVDSLPVDPQPAESRSA